MNTDYMNFNFVGSLKLLTKKKWKEKKHKYKTQQNKETAILNRCSKIGKFFLWYQKTYSIMNNLNALWMKKVLVWCPVVKSYVILIYKQFWWINNVTVIFKRLKSLFIYFFIMQDMWRCIQFWILEMFWNIRFIWARLRNQTAKISRLLNEPKILLIFQKRCYVFCLSCNNIKHFTPKTSYFRHNEKLRHRRHGVKVNI